MKQRVLHNTYVLTVCLSLLLLGKVWAAPLSLNGIRIAKQKDHTRIVLVLNAPFTYQSFTLKFPSRLVVDLSNTTLKTSLKSVKLAKTDLTSIRSAVRANNTLRLVFDLKQQFIVNDFTLKPYGPNSYRLVLDLNHPKKIAKKIAVKSHKPTVSFAPPKPKITVPTGKQLRDVIVVIDPGHGGKDPGAAGLRRTREKNVVLQIAKELQRLVNQQSGMRAILTRGSDYYISLRERLNLARKDKGDIFIAIHADAYMSHSAHGASVFALSPRGASSEAARWLAERENYSELGGVDDFSDRSYLVRSVLLDLSQTVTISASLQLANDVLRNLGMLTRLHSDKVEQARFVVLKSPDIPSILVETGFISNPREEINLRDPHFQQRLALAILRGIKTYFWQHPPQGSLVAAQRNAKTYRVARGDNLVFVANHYKIPVKMLKRFNRLQSNSLKVGQVLRIPGISSS